MAIASATLDWTCRSRLANCSMHFASRERHVPIWVITFMDPYIKMDPATAEAKAKAKAKAKQSKAKAKVKKSKAKAKM